MQERSSIVERAKHVLGTILINPDAFWQVSDVLTPVMMPTDSLRKIAEVVWDRVYNAKPFDFTIVADESGVDISHLRDYYTNAHIDHAEAVRENFLTKQVSAGMNELSMNLAEGRPVQEAVQMFLNQYELLNQNFESDKKPGDAYNSVKEYVLSKNRARYGGVPTGLSDLDSYTGGYQPGKLYVIGGNPGQGKSTVMLASALAAAKAGKHTLLFSLEMPLSDLVLMLACMYANADEEKLAHNAFSDAERRAICDAVDALYEMPIYIFDLTMIDNTVEAVAGKVYAFQAKEKCDAVYIDYLQLMTSRVKKNSIEQEVAYISRTLKVLSIKANCPVILLSQLNRENMKRASKRPDIGDLRYSGQIQADADFIGLPYRPELYGITEDDRSNSLKGVTQFIIGKFRQLGAKVPHELYWQFKNSNLHPLIVGNGGELDEPDEQAEPSPQAMNATMNGHAPKDDDYLPF